MSQYRSAPEFPALFRPPWKLRVVPMAAQSRWIVAPPHLLEFPPLPPFLAKVLLSIRGVGGAHGVGVPFEFSADAEGDVAKVIGLGEPAGVLEVGQGLLAVCDRVDPFLVVA